jgi:hypothetical protein
MMDWWRTFEYGGYAMKTKVFGLVAICTVAAIFAPMTAEASTLIYDALLTGPSESPPNASPGTGFATVTIDTSADTMNVNVTFSGLLGTTTASHIHCCTAIAGGGTAGVATTVPYFTGFPIGVTSGSYNQLFDMTQASSYNPAFETAEGGTTALAFAALLAGLADGEAYLNIHTTVIPGGEIRGFLEPTVTPLPSTWFMLLSGFVGLGFFVYRGTKKNTAALAVA